MRFILTFTFLLTVISQAAGLDEWIGEFQADRRDLDNSPSVSWSSAFLKREDALFTSWEKRLDGLDYDSLDPTARIDWHLLRTSLRERRDKRVAEGDRLREILPVLAFSQPLLEITDALASHHLADARKSADALARAATDLEKLHKSLEAGHAKDAPADAMHLSPAAALQAADAVDELGKKLASWYALYDGFQPDFTWWNRQPHEALTTAMNGFTGFLRKEIAGQKGEPDDPLIGNPIGADAIQASLRAEMIPYTAEELIGLAEKEFAWCELEMKAAATALGCESPAAAIEKVKANHAPPGEQTALVIAEAEKATRFVKENELVTVPPLAEESWSIGMLDPKQQKSLPYAVYSQPRIMAAYAHESMNQGDKLESMRGNAYGFLHLVTPHELIPGHHLQGFMARRHAAYRSAFDTPFLVEGWALHWEMLLWERGYFATPEEKVGALFWRMHRCARVIVSLRFHLGQMTPPEMIDFLVDKVGHERSGATAEVRRYIGTGYSPLYQVGYMIGGIQIHALQKELTSPAAASPLTVRRFHDQILLQGPVPVEMIRASLIGKPLPKSWVPAWRFAN